MKLRKNKEHLRPLSEPEIRRIGNLLSHAKTKAIGTLLGEEYVHNEFNYIGDVEFPELSFLTYNNTYIFAIGIHGKKHSIFRFPRKNLSSIQMSTTGFKADDLIEVLEDDMQKEILQLDKGVKSLPKKKKRKRKKK